MTRPPRPLTGEPAPKATPFCWWCSRQLQGYRGFRALGEDGREHLVHKLCAEVMRGERREVNADDKEPDR